MHFENTSTVILNNKKISTKICLYVPEKQAKQRIFSHYLQSSVLCSTDQLTVEVIRNCDMPFFAEN